MRHILKSKKILFAVILVVFFFVVNFAAWQGIAQAATFKQTTTSAGVQASAATMAGGVCAASGFIAGWAGGWWNPAGGKQSAECLNGVLVAIWKAAVFPLIKRLVYNLVLKGDFGLTWEGLKDWFFYDLVFQTVEQVLNKIGLSLCTKLSVTLKLVLYQSVSPDYAPQCTFQQSELAQIIDQALRGEDEAAWARLRRDFFGMFYLQSQPTYNQFGQYWLAKAQVYKGVAKGQQSASMELSFSNGFFGTRDCKDQNNDGKVDKPQECTVVTPGRWIADRVFGEQTLKENAALQTQVLADLGSLTAEILDILINKQISGFYNDLNQWVSSQKEAAERDYFKALQKEQNQNQSPIGGNQSIDFPAQKSGYSVGQ